MNESLKIIARALEKSRKNTFVILVTMAGFTLCVPFGALVRLEEHQGIYYALLCLTFFFFGGLTLYTWLRYRKYMDAGNSPIIQAVNTPGRVVWFYEKEARDFFFVYLFMNDGKSEYFHLDEDEIPVLMDALEQQLPGAVRGFSKENEKRYKQDPAGFGQKIS